MATPVCCIAYRRFGTTEVDRRLLLAIPVMFFMQGVVATGGWLLGESAVHLLISMPALWGTMCALVGVLVEPRILPAAVSYIIAFFLGAAMPEYRLYVMSAANAILTINALAWYRLKCRSYSSSDAARS
jgi:hypothetical protein